MEKEDYGIYILLLTTLLFWAGILKRDLQSVWRSVSAGFERSKSHKRFIRWGSGFTEHRI